MVSSIASTTDGGLDEVAEIARTEIVPELSGIDGVAQVDLTGGLEERLAVTLDPTKLAASGVSTQQIVGILQANNLTLPSGQLNDDGSQTPVSTIGRFTSEEEVSNLVVGYTQPATVVPPIADGPERLAGPVGGARPARTDHPRRPGHGQDRGHRHDRLRPDERQALAQPHGLEDLCRQYRRRRR